MNGILQDYALFWKNYANFRGRTPRRGYWMMVLWNAIIYIVLSVLLYTLGYSIEVYYNLFGIVGFGNVSLNAFGVVVSIILGVYTLASIIPFLALTVRRLHDTGKTAKWLVFPFIPAIYLVVFLIIATFQAIVGLDNLFDFNYLLGTALGWFIGLIIGGVLTLGVCITWIVFMAQATSPNAIGVSTHDGSAPSSRPLLQTEASLLGTRGMYSNVSFPLGNSEEIILGRDAAFSHIVIDQNADKVSRKHASVRYDASSRCYLVTDYSLNGTFKEDGTRLLTNVATSIPRGTTINLGSAQHSFRLC